MSIFRPTTGQPATGYTASRNHRDPTSPLHKQTFNLQYLRQCKHYTFKHISNSDSSTYPRIPRIWWPRCFSSFPSPCPFPLSYTFKRFSVCIALLFSFSLIIQTSLSMLPSHPLLSCCAPSPSFPSISPPSLPFTLPHPVLLPSPLAPSPPLPPCHGGSVSSAGPEGPPAGGRSPRSPWLPPRPLPLPLHQECRCGWGFCCDPAGVIEGGYNCK